MALTEEQLLLIHAGIDHETSAVEAAALEMLLQSSAEAREEHAEIIRLRTLLQKFGAVRAPDSLRSRVLQAIRPAPVIQLPARGWRNALLAAAAVVVISLGLIFSATPTPEVKTPEPTAAAPMPEKPQTQAPVLSAGESPAGPKATAAVSKLNLDRGHGAPLEVNVNFSREGADVLRAYYDLLATGREFGEASLLGHEAGRWDDTAFAGTDFTVADGVMVQLPEDDLPALLAAIEKQAADRGLGRLIVPQDMLDSVAVAGEVTGRRDALPPPAENSRLRVTGRPQTETNDSRRQSRKVNVIIRLR